MYNYLLAQQRGQWDWHNVHLIHSKLVEELAFQQVVRLAARTGAGTYFVHVTASEGLVVGMRSMPGNPYDVSGKPAASFPGEGGLPTMLASTTDVERRRWKGSSGRTWVNKHGASYCSASMRAEYRWSSSASASG
jgi:hypothetical protein